jgi:hypothetical protein
MTKTANRPSVQAVVRPSCPKCGREVIGIEYDASSNATLLTHGRGHRIAGTRLHHVDACLVLGQWPNARNQGQPPQGESHE